MFEFNNLTYKIGSKTLRQPVSGRARPGEILTVVGANGAGKSTLPRLLSGDLKLSSGGLLARWPLVGLARRRAGLMQQHPRWHSRCASWCCWATTHISAAHPPPTPTPRWPPPWPPWASRTWPSAAIPRSWGGGQQRAHLARVLAQAWAAEGGFLLLDKPLTGLDLRQQHHTLEVARYLARERGFGIEVELLARPRPGHPLVVPCPRQSTVAWTL